MADRAATPHADLAAEVSRGTASLFERAAEWDELLGRSETNSVFLTSAWLLAWSETVGRDADVFFVRVYLDGRLVAAAGFEREAGELFLVGRGADCADVVIDAALDDADYLRVLRVLLGRAADAAEDCRNFRLIRLPERSRTVRALERGGSGFFANRFSEVGAPVMDMAVAAASAGKKRSRQRERRLQREGALACESLLTEAAVVPCLETFFAQHVRRWENTSTPSRFLDATRREFYRALVRRLAAAGKLRFGTLTLDGRLIASHLGFLHDDTFTYYKPTYDMAFARFSPGDVLLKHLFEHAARDGARWFDFSIGDEAYKLRFATETRNIVSLHVTRSRFEFVLRRAHRFTRARLDRRAN